MRAIDVIENKLGMGPTTETIRANKLLLLNYDFNERIRDLYGSDQFKSIQIVQEIRKATSDIATHTSINKGKTSMKNMTPTQQQDLAKIVMLKTVVLLARENDQEPKGQIEMVQLLQLLYETSNTVSFKEMSLALKEALNDGKQFRDIFIDIFKTIGNAKTSLDCLTTQVNLIERQRLVNPCFKEILLAYSSVYGKDELKKRLSIEDYLGLAQIFSSQ